MRFRKECPAADKNSGRVGNSYNNLSHLFASIYKQEYESKLDIGSLLILIFSHPERKASCADASSKLAPSQGSSGGAAPIGPSLGGLFAGGFPALKPMGQRDFAGKTPGGCCFGCVVF